MKKVLKALKEGGLSLLIKRLWFFIKPKQKPSYKAYIKHPWVKAEMIYVPTKYSEEDQNIAIRILAAYDKCLQRHKRESTGDIWDLIQQKHHDFHILTGREVPKYLANMHNESITLGISSATSLEKSSEFTADHLLILAEALGVIPLNRNREWDEELHELVRGIESTMGIRLGLPNIDGGILKLKIGSDYFVHRDFWSAHLAWKVKDYKNVAEIGGGIGKVAIYARRLGVRKYAIYDLPIISLVQAWYLLKCGVEVRLYGEEPKKNAVEILPYWEFARGTHDVVLNADSFPEMDVSIVKDYLEKIREMKIPLISVNAEEEGEYGSGRKHLIVGRIAQEVGLDCVSRTPYWFLENYADELWKTK